MCRLVVAGYTTLFLACGLAYFSFFAPIWIHYPYKGSAFFKDSADDFAKLLNVKSGVGKYIEGLLGFCNYNDDCFWVWSNNFQLQKALPDWLVATQGLFSVGLFLLEVAWFVATFHICCCLCKSSPIGPTLGSITLSAMILLTAAVSVYGVYAQEKYWVSFSDSSRPMFSWAFYGALGSIVASLIATILFFAESCRNRSYSQYYMAASV